MIVLSGGMGLLHQDQARDDFRATILEKI